MRGTDRETGKLFSYPNPDSLVPKDHPLRAIRALVNGALGQLSPTFCDEGGLTIWIDVAGVARELHPLPSQPHGVLLWQVPWAMAELSTNVVNKAARAIRFMSNLRPDMWAVPEVAAPARSRGQINP